MTTATQHTRLTTVLDDVIQADPHSMKAQIAQIIMDHDAPETYLSDILNYGCVSGTVPEMTYYRDTHQFFDRYYDEIEEIREDREFQTGTPINIKGDLKNYLAWFAFEHIAWEIANEAELEF